MMKAKYILKLCSVCCSIAATLPTFTACNDIVTYADDIYTDPALRPNTDKPQILGIYEVRDVIYDNKLDSVTPGQRVRIHGTNLAHVRSITVNGFACDMSQVAAASDYCIAYIPAEFTINQTEGLVYTTDLGSVTCPIAVRCHELELDGLYNAFAEAGAEAEVVGRWFRAYCFNDDSRATVHLGDTKLEVRDVTNDGMKVVIPPSAADNSIITFSWLDANDTQQHYQCYYRPSSYLCFSELNLSLGDSFYDQPGYNLNASIDGDTLCFEGNAKQWGWYSANIDSQLHTLYDIAGVNDYEPAKVKGYHLAFEVKTLAPIPSSADNDVNGITFSIEWGDRTEWCPSTTTEEFHTKGEWRTVTLPLSDVAQKGLRPSSWGGTTHLGIIISPIVDNAIYNFRLTNFRIVKDLNTLSTDSPNDEPDTLDTPDTPDIPDTDENSTASIVLFDGSQILGTEGNDAVTIETDKCTSLELNDYICITITDLIGGWCQLNLAGCNPWTTHPDTNWSTFTEAGTLKFQITKAVLLESMRTGGMMIQGKNCTITHVEIQKQQ